MIAKPQMVDYLVSITNTLISYSHLNGTSFKIESKSQMNRKSSLTISVPSKSKTEWLQFRTSSGQVDPAVFVQENDSIEVKKHHRRVRQSVKQGHQNNSHNHQVVCTQPHQLILVDHSSNTQTQNSMITHKN